MLTPLIQLADRALAGDAACVPPDGRPNSRVRITRLLPSDISALFSCRIYSRSSLGKLYGTGAHLSQGGRAKNDRAGPHYTTDPTAVGYPIITNGAAECSISRHYAALLLLRSGSVPRRDGKRAIQDIGETSTCRLPRRGAGPTSKDMQPNINRRMYGYPR